MAKTRKVTKPINKLPRIEVHTLNNGYALEFDGMQSQGGHLYFSVDQLLKGFMIHIGLKKTAELDPSTMADFIETSLNYKDNEKAIREIESLNTKIWMLRRSRGGMANRLVAERARVLSIIDDIKSVAREAGNKALEARIRSVVGMYHGLKPLTLKELGIRSSDIVEDGEEEEV
jgi:hypothetical protein